MDLDSDYSTVSINKGIKKLYKTGFFQEIIHRSQDSLVYISVVENQIIKSVNISGNKNIEAKILQNFLVGKVGEHLSEQKATRDKNVLVALYKSYGYLDCTIDIVTQILDNRFISLNINIDEGKQYIIKQVDFVGNNHFQSERLRSLLTSKKEIVSNFLFKNNLYIPNKISFLKKKLELFYKEHGFIDCNIQSEITPNTGSTGSLLLTFFISEGKSFNFTQAKFNIRSPKINRDQLSELIQFKQGQFFNEDLIVDTETKLRRYLQHTKQLSVEVSHILKVNRIFNTIEVEFLIKNKSGYRIRNISVKGNFRTEEHVIRRELIMSEEDFFSEEAVNLSKRNLENLGYFKNVSVLVSLIEDKKDINIIVEEDQTGTLKFSAGYDNTQGIVGDIALSENNLFGKGRSIELDINKSEKNIGVILGFTDPRFLNENISLGFDLFTGKTDGEKTIKGSQRKKGGMLRAGYAIGDFVFHKLHYSLESNNIVFMDTAPFYLKEEPTRKLTSSVGQSFVLNKSNYHIFPTTGHILKISQSLLGGGDGSKLIKHEFEGKKFKQIIGKDIVLNAIIKGGNIFSCDSSKVSVTHSFFLGEEHIRGFDINGIGPRYQNNPIGGKNYLSGTLELQFPVGAAPEQKMKGYVFTDVATLFDNDLAKHKTNEEQFFKDFINDSKFLRISWGLGILWHSPLGPVRIDYGVPLRKEPFDVVQNLRFSLFSNF